MSVLKIVEWPAEVLETPAKEVTSFDEGFRSFVSDMHLTMEAAHGIGLAANQVGDLRRVFVIKIPFGDGGDQEQKQVWHDKAFTFVNPRITKSAGKMKYQEGCLSFPEIYEYIERPSEIWVEAQDENGREFEIHATGLFAICIQHELDHINGIVFINRMTRLKSQMVRKRIMRRAYANAEGVLEP